MNFIDQDIEDYALAHSLAESDVLKKLNRETHANVLLPRMLSGHAQGNFLIMLSKMIRPQKVLEVGTYTGYSAICLAQGLQKGGTLYTIDIDEERVDLVTRFLEEANLTDNVIQIIGPALDKIPTVQGEFDIVFLDADKKNYSAYYDLVIDKVSKGGYIIADNVLWSGKVALPIDDKDKDTIAIDGFNKKVHNDPRVENCLFPLRDGLMIARKL